MAQEIVIPADSNVGKVESVGLETIQESERKGKPRDLFMPWFACNISVFGLSWGAWVLGFGLSFMQAVIVSLVGIAISFLFCGCIAILGKRGSAPTLTLSRAAFGYNGNRLSAGLSWILTVGWETVLCILATLATATVLTQLGFENQTVSYIIGFVVVLGLAAAAAVLGFDTIMKVQTWITWITAILTIAYLVLALQHADISAVLSMPAGEISSCMGALIMLMAGFGLGWVNAAADYSRYLPRNVSTGGVVFWTTFGASLPCFILVFFGLILVGSNPSMTDAISNDPIGALITILPTWFLIPFALVAILGLVAGIIMDLYSSGLSLLATGVKLSRPVATAIDTCIMASGTIYVVFFAENFLGPFMSFLVTLGVIIAAWAGIMLAEVVLRKRDYDESSLYCAEGIYGSINWIAIALLVIASIIGWGFVVNATESWLAWQGYFMNLIGGKEGPWAFTNIGVMLALAVGFVGHLITGATRIRKQEGR